MYKKHSEVWIRALLGFMWLAGAAGAVIWMLNGEGLIRPVAAFAIFVTLLSLSLPAGILNIGKDVMTSAIWCGTVSGIVLLLGTLFVEYWPITASVACVFAIGRSLRTQVGCDVVGYSWWRADSVDWNR